MQKKVYKTKQSVEILEFLKQNPNDSINVQKIFNEVNKKNRKVGLTTIYRHLDKLIATGHVKKYFKDDTNEAFYQYFNTNECNNHCHLKCKNCMKLIHVLENDSLYFNNYFNEKYDFDMDMNDTIFYGLCNDCRK